jgi:hypothetical protein
MCFAVLCVTLCFIVMYVVSLFSMLSYCLVCSYYLSHVFILSVLCCCVVCSYGGLDDDVVSCGTV